MVRTAVSRVFLGSLLAACGGDQVCHLDQCGNAVCTDLQTDPDNCGTCGSACGTDQTCNAGACADVPGDGSGSGSGLVCNAPETACGSDLCADLSIDPKHCGTCDTACVTVGATTAQCMTGHCANPLVAMRTEFEVDGDFTRDLFVLDDVTLALTQVNQPAFDNNDTDRVVDQAVLADGRVVFVAHEDSDSVTEIYVTSPFGGTPVKLNPTLVAGGNVQPGIVVRGTTVLYVADQDVQGVANLYAVDVDHPGTTAQVNPALADGGRMSVVFALSDDAKVAVYVADQDTPGLDEAYAVTLAAPGVSTKLNPPLVNGVWDLALAGDGSFIVYRNDDAAGNQPQLFAVALANAGVAVHVDNSVDQDYVAQNVYRIDGHRLFYTGGSQFLADSLWSVLVDFDFPLDSIQLHTGGNGVDVRTDFVVDHGVALYRVRDNDQEAQQLFAVPGSGLAAPTAIATAADSPVTDVAVSANGRYVAFRTGADGAEGGIVFRGTASEFNSSGNAPRLAEVDLGAAGGPAELEIANVGESEANIAAGYVVLDDGRVVFMGDLDVSGQQDAYLSNGSADGFVKVSPPLGDASGSAQASDVVSLTRF